MTGSLHHPLFTGYSTRESGSESMFISVAQTSPVFLRGHGYHVVYSSRKHILLYNCVSVYLKVCLHSLLPELSITLFSEKLECIIKARLLESIFSFFKENLKEKTETVASTYLKKPRCFIPLTLFPGNMIHI